MRIGGGGSDPASIARPPATRLIPNVGAPGGIARAVSASENFAGMSGVRVPAPNAIPHEASASSRHGAMNVAAGLTPTSPVIAEVDTRESREHPFLDQAFRAEEDAGSDDRNEKAPDGEAVDARRAEQVKEETADDRADDAEDQVEEEPAA